MNECKAILMESDKIYLLFIIKPEVGSAHYMAGFLRKDMHHTTLFLFNPTGYPDKERAKRRLNLASATTVAGMPLILSPHAVQSEVNDEGRLVSCGPLCVDLVHYALNNPNWMFELDERFLLPPEFLFYLKASSADYKQGIIAIRARHDELLDSIKDEALDQIDDFYSYTTQRIFDHLPMNTEDEEEDDYIYSDYGSDDDAPYSFVDTVQRTIYNRPKSIPNTEAVHCETAEAAALPHIVNPLPYPFFPIDILPNHPSASAVMPAPLNDVHNRTPSRENTPMITQDDGLIRYHAIEHDTINWSWSLRAMASVFFAAVAFFALGATIYTAITGGAIAAGVVITVASALTSAYCFCTPDIDPPEETTLFESRP